MSHVMVETLLEIVSTVGFSEPVVGLFLKNASLTWRSTVRADKNSERGGKLPACRRNRHKLAA